MKYELRENYLDDFDLIDPFFEAFVFGNNYSNEVLKTDIEEQEKAFIVKINMPGIDKKDIKISLDNGYLNVGYELKEKYNSKGRFLRRERKYESASRSFYLGEVKEEEINAKLENGVLSIYLPKKEEEKEHKFIKIN